MNDSINRRNFLKQASAAGIGLGMAGYFGSVANANAQTAIVRRKLGPNDKITAAVIGNNGRGLAHVGCLTSLPGVEITHICDVDDRAIAKGVKATLKNQKTEPKGVKDFRKILEDKNVDVVTIATPDHWHAPMAILALQAGNHVYVEKPSSHNPREGELLVEAQKKYGKLVQVGDQQRSSPHTIKIIKDIHEGRIGTAYYAKAWYVNRRKSMGIGKPAPVPSTLNWDLWQGPAPRSEYKDNIQPYTWHWLRRYGTGETLNNGTHEVDICRWALDVTYPNRVTSAGGRYEYK